MASPPPETSPTQSPAVCPLDCPDTCSLSITHDGAQILGIRGSNVNPFTAGRVCQKVVKGYPEFTHGPNRLRYPMRRIGRKGSGEFERIEWDDAIELAYRGLARAVDQFGPQAVVPFNYAGPHGMLADGSMDRRFFHRLGASLLDRGTLCGGIRSLAYSSLFGTMPGAGPEQLTHAQLIVVWSNNVTVSNLHLTRVIDAARRQGARLVVIDPKRIKIADRADLFIPIRPGTDVVLAYALANELERLDAIDQDFVSTWTLGFDRFMAKAREYPVARAANICGVPASDIRTLAEWYARANPAALAIGNGMERSLTGGASLRAAMALPALAGKFGIEGGGLAAKPGSAFPRTTDRLQRTDWIPTGTRTLNILDISRHIVEDDIDPPVRGLVIYNHNPVATHPDQRRMRKALAHPDLFTLGIEIANTDSMAFADVILPAAGPFEIHDIYGSYGQQYLQRAEPVISPVGESLANTEIFRRLAARFGFNEIDFTEDDLQLIDASLDRNDPKLMGLKPSEIPLDQAVHMRIDGETIVAFKNAFPTTSSGKVELYSEALEQAFGAGLPEFKQMNTEFPLQLITPSSALRTNATFGGVSAGSAPEIIELHPNDATARDLVDGDAVRVFNDLGETQLTVRVSHATREGVAYSPKGVWLDASAVDHTVNALVHDLRSDIADGACFNNTYVDVSPL
ncbi:MAG: molybdopterin-dependent oxidoreductase [Pseudomonadota bacterium]